MTTDHDRLLERMEGELEQWDRAGLGDLGGVSRDIRLLIERVKLAEARVKEAEEVVEEQSGGRIDAEQRLQLMKNEVRDREETLAKTVMKKRNLEARLRAAEEVVEAAKSYVYQENVGDYTRLIEALRRYDQEREKS